MIWYLEYHTFFTGGDQSKEGEISFPKLQFVSGTGGLQNQGLWLPHLCSLLAHHTPSIGLLCSQEYVSSKMSEGHMDGSDCQNYPSLSQYKCLTVFISYIQQSYIFPKILPNS